MQTRKHPTKAKHMQKVNILFDSGCGATLVRAELLKNLPQQRTSETTWTTKAGSFSTSRKCKCKFTLPEFHENRKVEWNVYVDESKSSLGTYDMIIGRDLMDAIGMDLLFSENLMKWDNATVPMRDTSWFNESRQNPYTYELHSMHDTVTTEVERIQGILDIKYAPADLDEIARESRHLSERDRKLL